MISKIFLIGNGESRSGFDLNTLKGKGKIYGCNALYRDFTPDVLVGVDIPTIKELIESDYAQNDGELWVRNWPGKKWQDMSKGKNIHQFSEIFPDTKDFGWASGSSSAYIACKQNTLAKEVYLIGHDIVSNNKKINNIYKGTKNYFDINYKGRENLNWRNQWRVLFSKFPDKQFIKVNHSEDKELNYNRPIPQWQEVKNIKYITLKDLK